MELGDGPTRPAQVDLIRQSASSTFLEITITEGRNRQVRRMLEAVSSKVLKLLGARGIGAADTERVGHGQASGLTARGSCGPAPGCRVAFENSGLTNSPA